MTTPVHNEQLGVGVWRESVDSEQAVLDAGVARHGETDTDAREVA